MNVGARQVRRRRADRDRPHRRERIVKPGARGHRERVPWPSTTRCRLQLRPHPGGPSHRSLPAPTRIKTRCSGHIFGVGHACHLRAQQGPQLLEFGPCVVASHLLAGDDRDGPVDRAQSAHDRMWITDERPRRLNTTPVMSVVAVDADLRLLNIFGQQQHCRTAGSRRRYSAGQRRHDVGGRRHPPAEDRDRRKQRLGIQRAITATGVLKAAPTIHGGGRLAHQRQHRYPAGQ